MLTHPCYTISFTDHAKSLCQQMNERVRLGHSVDEASKLLGLSKTSGRRYYSGSYDVNYGWRGRKLRKPNFTCMRLGAKVDIA